MRADSDRRNLMAALTTGDGKLGATRSVEPRVPPVCGQGPPQMPRAEDKNVIQTVAPKRSNQAFSICSATAIAVTLVGHVCPSSEPVA